MPTLKATLLFTGYADPGNLGDYLYGHKPATKRVIEVLNIKRGIFGGDPESPPKQIIVSIEVSEPAYENMDKISQTGEFRGNLGMM